MTLERLRVIADFFVRLGEQHEDERIALIGFLKLGDGAGVVLQIEVKDGP